jgi:hypothetical protein
MLRAELIKGVAEIVALLRDTGIFDFFTRPSSRDPTRIVSIVQEIAKAELSLSPASHEILAIMNLADLLKADFWAPYFAGEPATRDDRFVIARMSVRYAVHSLPKVIALLKRSTDDSYIAKKRHAPDQVTQPEKLTVILPEDLGPSSPARVVMAIDAIADFYNVVCELEGLEAGTLAVAACDSGSDKVFDFVGLDKAIKHVKDLILELWDRVVFFRERKGEKGLEVLCASLSVVEKIDALRESGSLRPEAAELLKRQAIRAVSGFCETGALIEEITTRAILEPRSLTAPAPKLIAGPRESTNEREQEDAPRDLDLDE